MKIGSAFAALALVAGASSLAAQEATGAQGDQSDTVVVIEEDAAIPMLHRGRSSQTGFASANRSAIRNWRGAGMDTIYIQDTRRRWYRAKLIGTCCDLTLVREIGFDSGIVDTFDSRSSVIIRGQSYGLQSFDRIEAPPEPVEKAARSEPGE